MSKISDAFKNKKAFIAYVMAGDPDIEFTRNLVISLERAGADIIELGIPFSDPIAEGEVIQAASVRALQSGTTLEKVLDLCASLRGKVSIPLLLMTYLNPVFNYGYQAFFKRCNECGVAGLIIPDMPFEEQDELSGYADNASIDIITLIAPTSEFRIEKAVKNARGFIYMVSSMGVTGARKDLNSDILGIIKTVRKYTTVPVAVGFGVHTPEQAANIGRIADGVIVGSAIVDAAHNGGVSKAESYVRSMKEKMSGIK